MSKPATSTARQPESGQPVDNVIPFPIQNFMDAGDALAGMEVDDEEQELNAEPDDRINDAEIYGVMSDGLANLPIVIATGKSQMEKEWNTSKQMRFEDFFKKVLSTHKVGKKDGNALVTGALGKSKRRTKNNVLANCMMGLDVDSGASMQDTFDHVRRAGLTAIFYTTHSHGTTRIEIASDKFIRWAEKNELDTEPTDALIQRYMREETNYIGDVCDSAVFVEKVHEDGIKLIVQTRPIDKFRVIFPLATPYVYADQNSSHKDAIEAWTSRVLGMGRSIGVEVDRAARDPSRLFYLPRHDNAATNYRIMLNCGRLLKFEDIPTASTSTRVTGDPFEAAGAGMSGRSKPAILSPSGFDLTRWAGTRADGFDVAGVFRDHCDDRIRVEQTPNKLTVECPFDDDHSNPGDPEDQGTFICSGGEEAESFIFHCSHAGCHGRDRLTFLQKALQDDWFPDSVFTDDRYDLIDRGEDAPEKSDDDVENLWSLVEQVKAAHAATGKRDPKLLSQIAEKVVAINDATLDMEVLDAFTDAFCKTVRDQDQFRRDWNKLLAGARKKLPSRHDVPRGFDDLRISKKETLTGRLIPSTNGPYKIKDGGVFFEGDYICQEVFHKSYGLNARGENATHTIEYRAYTSTGEKEFSFRRADLAKGDDVVAALGDAGFHYDLDRKPAVRAFLNNIHLPPDALIVDSSGWHGGSFVLPDGTFIPASADTPKMQLGITTALTPFRASKGTIAGWIDAVAPVFEGNGIGKEHWALCVMAGCAGTLLGYLKTQGLQSFALIGPSSIGKSVGAKLMASVQGPINQNGLFFNCNMTANAAELVFVARNGLSPILDEAHKAPDPSVLKRIAWSDDGSGKGRSVGRDGRYVLGEIDTFVGMLCVTSELRIRAVLENAGIPVPPGQDARLFEIQCNNVKQFPDPAFIDRMVRDAESNHGHALEAFVRTLMKETRDDVQKDWEQAHAALARPEMSSLERRSLEPLATIYLAGKIMQETGLIPESFDVRRILNWAIDNRAGGTEVADARATAYAALRSAYVKLRSGGQIPAWGTMPAQANTKGRKTATVEKAGEMVDVHYVVEDGPIADRLWPVGYDYSEPGSDDAVIFIADEFPALIGHADVGITLGYLAADGHLILTGKNRKHTKLPKAPHTENYRIRKAFFDQG